MTSNDNRTHPHTNITYTHKHTHTEKWWKASFHVHNKYLKKYLDTVKKYSFDLKNLYVSSTSKQDRLWS